jgi:hypothetical protein
MDKLLQKHSKSIKRIAGSHGVQSIRVFGSFARGEENINSDIDFLVVLEPNRSLFDIISLKHDLEDLLGRQVDIVTEKGISPYMAPQILAEAISL